MVRRSYSNWLLIEDYTPDEPIEVSLDLDGTRLVVERKSITKKKKKPEAERSETSYPSAEAARAAFDAEVAKLLPRGAIPAPEGEDGSLVWVGPGKVARRRGWRRVDALGEEPHAAENAPPGHADARLSGLLAIADVGFRGALVDTVRLTPKCENDPFPGGGMLDEAELVAFLKLPVAAGLRRIVLGTVGEMRIDGNPVVDNQLLVDAIGTSGAKALRDVELVGRRVESIESLAKLPAIERITTPDTRIERIGALASPTLVELRLCEEKGFLDLDISALDCPMLEAVTVRTHFGDIGKLRRFLDSELKLRRLELAPQRAVAELIPLLAASPLVARLDELVVEGIDPQNARQAVSEAGPQLGRLKHFMVVGID